MAFAKFQENRFKIDGDFAENHTILVNLTASIKQVKNDCSTAQRLTLSVRGPTLYVRIWRL